MKNVIFTAKYYFYFYFYFMDEVRDVFAVKNYMTPVVGLTAC